MSVHQLKDGRWIVQYPNPEPPPRLLREYFGRGPSARLKAEQRDGELTLKETRPRQSQNDHSFLFYEIAAEYVSARQLSKSTSRNMGYILKAKILPALGNIPAVKITSSTLNQYVAGRLKSVKSVSVRREIVYIKTILNWASKNSPPLIPYNPVRDFPLPRSDDSDILTPPSPQEIDAILQHAPEHLVRAIKIAYFTGLRPGKVEMFSLSWESVLWDRNVIRILSAKKGGPILRDIPIHPEFKTLLLKWWEADGRKLGPIIRYANKGVKDNMTYSWRTAKKRAGITRRLPFYFLRHDFVTTALENGIDIKTLSEIVGSSPETLRRHYQHVSGQSKIKAIEAIRPGNISGNNLTDNR